MSETKRLDWRVPQSVTYAVPLWLRDEQIKVSCARAIPRIEGHDGPLRSEPIAIACYGPSLADTWEKIRGFEYVMTCSGAHRFLIDRDIVPRWHVAVDPLPLP